MRWSAMLTAMLVVGCGSSEGDPPEDSDANTVETDTDAWVDERPPCEHFCAAVEHACADDTCLASCEASTTEPSQADITCAQKATSCEGTWSCWDFVTAE